MTKSDLIDMINEELYDFLTEISTTGGVAGYETPFAFQGNKKKNKKKRKESAEKSGYMIVKRFSDLNESVEGESNVMARSHYYTNGLAEIYHMLKNEMAQFKRDSKGTVNEDYENSKEAFSEAISYIGKAIQSMRAIKK